MGRPKMESCSVGDPHDVAVANGPLERGREGCCRGACCGLRYWRPKPFRNFGRNGLNGYSDRLRLIPVLKRRKNLLLRGRCSGLYATRIAGKISFKRSTYAKS